MNNSIFLNTSILLCIFGVAKPNLQLNMQFDLLHHYFSQLFLQLQNGSSGSVTESISIMGILILLLFIALFVALVTFTILYIKAKNKVLELDKKMATQESHFASNHEINKKEIYDELNTLRKSENNLQSLLVRAEESSRVRTTFLSNISEEFKKTLNEINGIADILKITNQSREEKMEYLQNIENNSNKILALIDDIIDLSRIESGELRLQKSNFSLNVMLLDLFNFYDNYKSKLKKYHIEILVLRPPIEAPTRIIGDKLRIEQVLSNLVLNALKYTYDGSIEFGYDIIKVDNHDFLRFYVRDTGVGIPKHLHHIIFDRFRQMDSTYTKDFGGSGLGLTVSRQIVKLMGGDMWVESEVGGGATFYFTIPYIVQNN